MYTKEFIYYLYHKMKNINYSFEISYEVGEITRPHDYNPDVDIICASGIHYFLSLEAALNYSYGILERYINNDTGLYIISYSDDGKHSKTRITNQLTIL